MSFVDDFEGIATAIQALKPDPFKPSDGLMETVEKYGEYAFKSPVVTDPNPPEYAEATVECGMYGLYPHGYLEAFEIYHRARGL